MASLLTALFGLVSLASAQTAGTFNATTFNVAGLPPVLNGNDIPGDKTTNTARIGQLLSQHNIDIVNVQEDFNFHATLYANNDHPYRTATSGGVPFGSGLNTLSNYNWTNFQRVKWNVCSNFDSADCLTPKGFTFMRVTLADGVSLDAFNLHADAGTSAADLKARAANIQQVSDYIKTHSAGNAVLVFGDSNTRYTRADDNPGLFSKENGMTDAWVELAKGGVPPAPGSDALLCSNPSTTTDCEIVDKMWYRGSPAFALNATRFRYAGNMFLQADGNILSDHDPVLVDFEWSKNLQWSIGESFGGVDGTWFNDLDALSAVGAPSVASLTLRGSERLDAISATLSSGTVLSHGGSGGTAATLTLDAGETLKSAVLCRGNRNGKARIFSATITTSKSRTLTAGKATSDCATITAPQGYNMVGFYGHDGDEIDKLGFIYSRA
ncbi:hypothetical protein DM02DRAFT_608066 [Periconia macrospinosa]|uniref:Jacalin-type lectin domain-containing protein n=1 Tax=Periconia macrospinosa TaxID=97972 RepID=A0A2V1EDU4_9PLEO|nr:hypothetical protein DM02DRAFT_608066 [Periconia macrospinosa]